ncbi:hypothetical protein CNR22_09915 [Sphingobacteriaceae bacterium]|nr:hypothetical protein CNR22_09915 [Sphingobacteriaceae bacterium]
MNKLIIYILIIISSQQLFSQGPSFRWAKSMGGPSDASGISITTDSVGNIFTLGAFEDSVDCDPGPGVANVIGYNSTSNVFISKLDSNGAYVWAKAIKGFNVYPSSIKLDAIGNIYVAGYFVQAYVNMGNSTFSITSHSAGYFDAFVCKLDANGNFIWIKRLGGALDDAAYYMEVNSYGDIYLTGSFQSTADFDPDLNTYMLSSANSDDVFVCKLDSSGNFGWATRIGGPGSQYATAISLSASGNVYITGNLFGTIYHQGSTSYTLNAQGGTDFFVCKLSQQGVVSWIHKIGSSSGLEYSNAIESDDFGNIYMHGSFGGTTDFDPGPNTYTLSPDSGAAFFVLKLDTAGNFKWAKNFVFNWNTYWGNKIIDSDYYGNVYLTGPFFGLTDFDPGPASYTASATEGAYVAKLDSTGQFLWARTFSDSSFSRAIQVDRHLNIYTTGAFRGTGDFNPFPSVYSLSSGVKTDAFITKWGGSCSKPLSATNTTGLINSFICFPNSTTLSASGGLSEIVWYDTTGAQVLFTGGNLHLANLSPGIYTYYAEAWTCEASNLKTPVTITVYAQPTLTIIADKDTICSGDQIQLNSYGANSFTWNTGSVGNSVLVNPVASVNYSLMGEDLNGCINTSSVNIFVNLLPVVNIVSTSSVICTGENVSLTASGADFYVWNDLSTSTTLQIAPITNATYSVVASDINGCKTTAFFTQTVDNCTGLNTAYNATNFKLFPNPGSGIFYVELSSSAEKINLEIYNATGKLVLSKSHDLYYEEIDLTTYANGLYYLKINGSQNLVVKLIKQ